MTGYASLRISRLMRICFVLALMLLLASGCAHQTVTHLKRNPWKVNQTQMLKMKYLVFSYACSQQTDSLQVRGSAQIRPETVPGWVQYAKDVWLGAYLSDRRGRVLANDLIILEPQTLNQSKGFPFELELEPQGMGSPGPLFLTFGYRLVLTSAPEVEDKQSSSQEHKTERTVFFASESSLLNY